jgi:hypothetical protein
VKISDEDFEATRQIYDAFLDKYITHVRRAQRTGGNLAGAHLDLAIFVAQHAGTLPIGFMEKYLPYIDAVQEHNEVMFHLLEDWRELIWRDHDTEIY